MAVTRSNHMSSTQKCHNHVLLFIFKGQNMAKSVCIFSKISPHTHSILGAGWRASRQEGRSHHNDQVYKQRDTSGLSDGGVLGGDWGSK